MAETQAERRKVKARNRMTKAKLAHENLPQDRARGYIPRSVKGLGLGLGLGLGAMNFWFIEEETS